jgi:hypothetical protein
VREGKGRLSERVSHKASLHRVYTKPLKCLYYEYSHVELEPAGATDHHGCTPRCDLNLSHPMRLIAGDCFHQLNSSLREMLAVSLREMRQKRPPEKHH